jgi:outer membrane protein OmpA-like peptidoglycan-associated protein
MSPQSDDEQQGLVLGLVFAILMMVVFLVLALAIGRISGAKILPMDSVSPRLISPASPVLPAAGDALTDAARSVNQQREQDASDAAAITVESGVVKFYFASGKAELAEGASAALVDVVKGARSGQRVVISGFHDASGGVRSNAELARRRGLAVRSLLLAASVPDSQIILEKPAQTTGSGGKAEARRVEITLR